MRNDLRTECRVRAAGALRALLEKRKQDVLAMLASCGEDPGFIPLWPEIWREDDGVHIDRYVRNEGGGIRVDDVGAMVEEAVIHPTVIPDWIAHA